MVDQRVYASRIRALQELQKAQGLDCVALVPGANLHYFTGLAKHLSERPLVAFFPAEGQPALALPVLEVPGARAFLPDDVQLPSYSDEEGHEQVFHQVAGAPGLALSLIHISEPTRLPRKSYADFCSKNTTIRQPILLCRLFHTTRTPYP